jgi:hypothetical protein
MICHLWIWVKRLYHAETEYQDQADVCVHSKTDRNKKISKNTKLEVKLRLINFKRDKFIIEKYLSVSEINLLLYPSFINHTVWFINYFCLYFKFFFCDFLNFGIHNLKCHVLTKYEFDLILKKQLCSLRNSASVSGV